MYVVKAQKLMIYLVSKGFVLEKVDTDRNNFNKKVFLFRDTPKLRDTITEYTRLKHLGLVV